VLQGPSGWTGQGYFPTFPATSPYVTAVGATQGPEAGDTEIACQSQEGGVITTGGGFSTYFPAPSWQQDAVEGYFTSLHPEHTPRPGYNPLGRGFPDVALLGAHYRVVVQGQARRVSSSAAAAATFAAMVTQLNAVRAAANQTTLGFLNPAMYSADKGVLRDITSGNNKCFATPNVSDVQCCASGFYATEGWDPVTGLGGLTYASLAELLDVHLYGSEGDEAALSGWEIALIVVGAFLAVVLAILLVFWLRLRLWLREAHIC
jgi:tripeptidyl-peptidase-1